jgi:hypothetical protein
VLADLQPGCWARVKAAAAREDAPTGCVGAVNRLVEHKWFGLVVTGFIAVRAPCSSPPPVQRSS